MQPTALMAEASSDDAGAHATEFLYFSLCLVFKVGDLRGPGQGWAPSIGSSTAEFSVEFKQLEELQHLIWRALTKITVWPGAARDPSVWPGGCVHHHTALLRQRRGRGRRLPSAAP